MSVVIVFICFLLFYVTTFLPVTFIFESGLDEVSNEFQGLSSTASNFKRLLRPWIFILKFKDFQGACEPCFQNLLCRLIHFYQLYVDNQLSLHRRSITFLDTVLGTIDFF